MKRIYNAPQTKCHSPYLNLYLDSLITSKEEEGTGDSKKRRTTSSAELDDTEDSFWSH